MFEDDTLKTLQALGYDVADAIRSLREGGPLDYLSYKTGCTKCGTRVCEPIRFFHERVFRCDCGGTYDDSAMQALIRCLKAGERQQAAEIMRLFFVQGPRPGELES